MKSKKQETPVKNRRLDGYASFTFFLRFSEFLRKKIKSKKVFFSGPNRLPNISDVHYKMISMYPR